MANPVTAMPSAMSRWSVNDWVIYHQPEFSTHPVPEARDVQPSERGDLYSYVVDHFWRVVRVNPDGTLEAVGRSGRVHRIHQADPKLEKAGWWARVTHRRFFPGV